MPKKKKLKIKNIVHSCGACPTIFDFRGKNNNHDYYFRLRHGYAKIVDETNDTLLISGKMNGFDGVCDMKDAIAWAKKNNLKLKL